MSKIEGELKINELGQILINTQVIYPGSIIEIQIQNECIEVCIEEAHGISYLIPLIDLNRTVIAKLKE